MIVTIRDIQPRESSEATEKSSDDIVYEIAETIVGKLVKCIDVCKCWPPLLWVNKLFNFYVNNFSLKILRCVISVVSCNNYIRV
jgi:hypothetical protein